MIPITLGTTSRIPPATPDLAGSPTWSGGGADRLKVRKKNWSGSDGARVVPHMEGELPGEVVHPTGVHQAERVPHRLRAQHALACDWTDAAVGQGGGHDAAALTGHLDGAQLEGNEPINPLDQGSKAPNNVCLFNNKFWF